MENLPIINITKLASLPTFHTAPYLQGGPTIVRSQSEPRHYGRCSLLMPFKRFLNLSRECYVRNTDIQPSHGDERLRYKVRAFWTVV